VRFGVLPRLEGVDIDKRSFVINLNEEIFMDHHLSLERQFQADLQGQG